VSRVLVYATAASLAKAWELLPDVVIENEVAQAIAAGNVKFARGHGTVEGHGWRAAVTRTEPRARVNRHPRPWLVLDIERTSEGGT
jgi:hypothetical protein